MPQMPTVELRIRDFGEQVNAILTLHRTEIQGYAQAGVERALAHLGEAIIDEAARLATQKVEEDVKHYLLYGAGEQAIRAAVSHALEPLTALLQGLSREEMTDDGPVTPV